jgi:glycosyltransferase involved in cell wall biosynthesis
MSQPIEPRACFVLPDGHGLGGVTTWSIKMAGLLARSGHAATVLEHVNPAVPWREEPEASVPWQLCHARHPGAARLDDVDDYLPHYLASLPAVLVPNYTHGAYAACAAASIRQTDALRVLAFAHADQDYYYELLARYEPIATLLVAVSEEIGERLRALFPHRRADVRVRPYGIDCASALQRAWSPPAATLRIAYAGRLVTAQKRVADLARLAAELESRSVDFVLDVYGVGVDEGALRAAIAALSATAQPRIRLRGRVPAAGMADVWRATDVAVLVSEYEGTSIAMLEAMAAGCVPVVTRVSGTRRAIDDGANGHVVPVGDMPAMADAIARLARDRERLAQMGRQAHARVRDQYAIADYEAWFAGIVAEAWRMPPRRWPADMPLLDEPAVPAAGPAPQPYVRYSLSRFLGKVARRLRTLLKASG